MMLLGQWHADNDTPTTSHKTTTTKHKTFTKHRGPTSLSSNDVPSHVSRRDGFTVEEKATNRLVTTISIGTPDFGVNQQSLDSKGHSEFGTSTPYENDVRPRR